MVTLLHQGHGLGLQVGWWHREVAVQGDAPLLAGACFWHWGSCHGVCSGICTVAGRRIWGLLEATAGLPCPASLRQSCTQLWAEWMEFKLDGTVDPAVAWLEPEDLLSCSKAAVASQAPPGAGCMHHKLHSAQGQHRQVSGRAGSHDERYTVLYISTSDEVQTLGVPPHCAPCFTPTAACCGQG